MPPKGRTPYEVRSAQEREQSRPQHGELHLSLSYQACPADAMGRGAGPS